MYVSTNPSRRSYTNRTRRGRQPVLLFGKPLESQAERTGNASPANGSEPRYDTRGRERRSISAAKDKGLLLSPYRLRHTTKKYETRALVARLWGMRRNPEPEKTWTKNQCPWTIESGDRRQATAAHLSTPMILRRHHRTERGRRLTHSRPTSPLCTREKKRPEPSPYAVRHKPHETPAK